MVRGHAKAVSQDKHNAKMADKAKSVKRDSNEASNLQSTSTFETLKLPDSLTWLRTEYAEQASQRSGHADDLLGL